MTTRWTRWAAGMIAAGSLIAGRAAQAQGPSPDAQGQLGLANAMYGNAPVAPYLNPYVMQMAPGNSDYLTYVYLQNQRSGGIGSGVISGTRPAPGAATNPAAAGAGRAAANPGPSTAARYAPYTSRPPIEQNRMTFPMATSSVPGTNTGGYFMRGPHTTAQGADRYFSRMSPARNNGR